MKSVTSVYVHACMQPVQLHGSLGREAATGRGTVLATRELLKHSRAGTIAGKSFVIQVSYASMWCSFRAWDNIRRQINLLWRCNFVFFCLEQETFM